MTLSRWRWLPCLSAVLVAGCLTISQPAPQIRNYRLEYPPPSMTGSPLPVVLSIPPLAVDAAYDRESIVYRPDEVSIGRYFYHRWSSNPGSLIGDMLKRDFARSGLYRAVQSGGSPLRADYRLGGEIEEIEERTLPDGSCAAHLSMRVELLHAGAGDDDPVVLRHTYNEDEPSPCEDPRSLSAAMSKALARISESLQQTVYAAIEAKARP